MELTGTRASKLRKSKKVLVAEAIITKKDLDIFPLVKHFQT